MHDPYERREQMYPRLSPQQLEVVRAYGTVRHAARGEVLVEYGAQESDWIVVLSGRVEIVQPRADGTERITVQGAGEFTGEMDMFSARTSLVRARVVEEGDVLGVPRESFRALLGASADLNETVMRAFILRRLGLLAHGQGDVVLVGSRHAPDTLRLRSFLSRNGQPHRYLELETDESARDMLRTMSVPVAATPVVLCRGAVLRNPSTRDLADLLGIAGDLSGTDELHDVIVIGAGPAGLAAAVYAASEGLDVLVLEADAPGGQAGTSSRIENYLGFPTGITGQELAGRAISQAQKFGARLVTPRRAARLLCDAQPYALELADGDVVRGRTIVIATGARYRRLDLPGIERYEGCGVYYGATAVEAGLCGAEDVVVVGGGNSAGQAAVYLADRARRVHLLVRRAELADTMSRYLVARVESAPNVVIHPRTEVVGLEGSPCVERQTWRVDGAREETHGIAHLFVMAGANPNTDWLRGCLALDRHGFVVTGEDLARGGAHGWPLERPPFFLETSRPRVFAAGDVRADSVKRVASAVGEGAMSVAFVHRVLYEAC